MHLTPVAAMRSVALASLLPALLAGILSVSVTPLLA